MSHLSFTPYSAPTRAARPRTVIGLVLASALILSACLTTQQASVLDAINASRPSHQQLATQRDAQAKAQAWAERLAREDRIYHSNLSDGIGVRWCNLGENVGTGRSVSQIHQAYMSSPGHRGNIVNPIWNGVGVGHATNTKHGYTKVFTVHVFIRTC